MKWILFGIAILWVGLGTWANLYPIQMHGLLQRLTERLAPRQLALAPLAVGILLVVAAPAGHQGRGLIMLLGLLGILKGLLLAFLPGERCRRLLDWWFVPAREQLWRVWGVVALVLGVVLLSWL